MVAVVSRPMIGEKRHRARSSVAFQEKVLGFALFYPFAGRRAAG